MCVFDVVLGQYKTCGHSCVVNLRSSDFVLRTMVLWLAIALALEALPGVVATKFNIQRVTSQREVAQNTAIPPASFVAHLSQKVPRRSSKKHALRELRRTSSKTAVVIGTDDDEEYATAVTVGGQDFQVIIDTGR